MVKGVSVRMAIVVSSAVEKASTDMIEGVKSSAYWRGREIAAICKM